MSTKLAVGASSNLYGFWGTALTDAINAEKADWVLNVASQEYAKAVQLSGIKQVITASFPGPAVYAKQARGGERPAPSIAERHSPMISPMVSLMREGELASHLIASHRIAKPRQAVQSERQPACSLSPCAVPSCRQRWCASAASSA